MRQVAIAALCALLAVAAASPGGRAADDPVALVRSYFAAAEPAARQDIAVRLASHPDYRPRRLREWLHAGAPFESLAPGVQELQVEVGNGAMRGVTLVVPSGYRSDRAWPLIYALHPSGVPARRWARQVEQTLGRRAREFVIASPEYEQNYIAAKPPFVPEHPAILDAVARRVHVAADRVYPYGYSKGGFAAWFVALYYPDRVAGAVAMAAGFDVAPGPDGFWKLLVPNVAHTPVFNAWGENDPLIARGLDEKPAGTFAESNRQFDREVGGMGLPIVNLEVPGGRHNALRPPPQPIVDILAERREGDPKRVSHTFRHLHQASCYWLEGLSWVGESWGDPPPAFRPAGEGESEAQALARTIEPLLGRLTGTIDGQVIRVTRRHVGELVVWLGERTIDWERPVHVEVDGATVFSGRVTRDPAVALARARATMDFETLRFAGIRLDASGKAGPVTADTLPGPAWRAGR